MHTCRGRQHREVSSRELLSAHAHLPRSPTSRSQFTRIAERACTPAEVANRGRQHREVSSCELLSAHAHLPRSPTSRSQSTRIAERACTPAEVANIEKSVHANC